MNGHVEQHPDGWRWVLDTPHGRATSRPHDTEVEAAAELADETRRQQVIAWMHGRDTAHSDAVAEVLDDIHAVLVEHGILPDED